MIGPLSACIWLSLSGCQTPPEPCLCGNDADEALHFYSKKLAQALEDKGNLRQQLKACEQRR